MTTTKRQGALAVLVLASLVGVVDSTTAVANEDVPGPAGVSSPDNQDVADNDPSIEFVNGALVVTEPPFLGPPPPSTVVSTELEAGAQSTSAITSAEAFALHSKPGSDKVIFLDLDGFTVSGTQWNVGRADPLVLGAYSMEPFGAENDTFSPDELNAVVEIWKRVSEDFSPWDVDVTTQDPGTAALSSDGAGDTRFGVRLVITHDSAWYGSAGGVALIGGFGSTYYSPAFVFSNQLTQGSAKKVAEAASHEIGHTLGLLHDGQVAADNGTTVVGDLGYYRGHGPWAPIMGIGYGRSVTQWSKGEYTDANNLEDDLMRIDQTLSRHSNSSANGPTILGSADSSLTRTIASGGAADTFRLDVTNRPATISVRNADPGGDLVAELVVWNVATGASIVRTVSPPSDPTIWTHVIDDIGPGSYTVEVRSIGYGTATTGFTNYGSIGRYHLDLRFGEATSSSVVTNPPPDPGSPGDGNSTVTPVVDPQITDPDTDNSLTPISPVRLLDTRQADALHRRLEPGDNIRVPVAGVGTIDADARAAVINVVAVDPAADGFLSVTPCTTVSLADRTSSLNFATGTNVANSTIATLTDTGELCIYSSARTDVVVDVTGAIGPSGSVGLTNTRVRRIADSRAGLLVPGRLAPGETIEIDVGRSVQAATTAVALNVTAVRPDARGYITIDDCAPTSATTAALNHSALENRGNNGIFALSPRRTICLRNTAATDITIDLTGEFQPGGLHYAPTTPVRLLDTRRTGGLDSGSTVAFAFTRPTGGRTPVAASVNIASTNHVRAGYVTSWNCGDMPESSALNPVVGQVTANGALAALSPEGRSCLFDDAGGQLIVDLTGFWL